MRHGCIVIGSEVIFGLKLCTVPLRVISYITSAPWRQLFFQNKTGLTKEPTPAMLVYDGNDLPSCPREWHKNTQEGEAAKTQLTHLKPTEHLSFSSRTCLPPLAQRLACYTPQTVQVDGHVLQCDLFRTDGCFYAYISLHMRSEEIPTPTQFILNNSGSSRKDECVISLPVDVMQLFLHAVPPSVWCGMNQQLSQSDSFKIGSGVWLFVHILTEAY